MKIVAGLLALSLFVTSGIAATPAPACAPGTRDCSAQAMAPAPLVIAGFKILDDQGNVRFSMNDKGQFWHGKMLAGTIAANGTVTDARGQLVAKLTQDGVLENAHGQGLLKIDPDGAIDNQSGVLVRWSPDGELTKGQTKVNARLSPADSPARRAASVLFFLAMTANGTK